MRASNDYIRYGYTKTFGNDNIQVAMIYDPETFLPVTLHLYRI